MYLHCIQVKTETKAKGRSLQPVLPTNSDKTEFPGGNVPGVEGVHVCGVYVRRWERAAEGYSLSYVRYTYTCVYGLGVNWEGAK